MNCTLPALLEKRKPTLLLNAKTDAFFDHFNLGTLLHRCGVRKRHGAGVTLFMILIGWAGYRSVHNVQGELAEIFSVRLPSINLLLQVDRDLQQLLVAERSMIFANVIPRCSRN